MRVATSLCLLPLVTAKVLDGACDATEWLQDTGERCLQSGASLIANVPPPIQPDFPYAYQRFGVRAVFQSIKDYFSGKYTHAVAQPLSRQTIPESDDEYKLGEAYFWGLTGIRDPVKAFEHYMNAAKTGDADALFMVGVGYATGFLTSEIPVNPAAAVFHYKLAAHKGSDQATIALAHRYMKGINLPEDFDGALELFDHVAEKLDVDRFDELPLRQQFDSACWSFGSEFGTGLYGKYSYQISEGSVSFRFLEYGHSRSRAKRYIDWLRIVKYPDLPSNVEDALEDLTFAALNDDDLEAYVDSAYIYYLGGSLGKPNILAAVENIANYMDSGQELDDVLAARCHDLLAQIRLSISLDGEPNTNLIHDAERHVKMCFNHAKGEQRQIVSSICTVTDVVLSLVKGASLDEAARIGEVPLEYLSATGASLLARYYLSTGNETDLRRAGKLLDAYERSVTTPFSRLPLYVHGSDGNLKLLQGKVFNEIYKINSTERNLKATVGAFSIGIENHEQFSGPMKFAHHAYSRGDTGGALLGFLVAAELGSLSAAMNLADLLDSRHSFMGYSSSWPLPAFTKGIDRSEEAIKWFSRVAWPRNPINIPQADAVTKLAEYELARGNNEAAVALLRSLTIRALPAPAWLLGWMYEHGVGVERRDYYMAGRFYERAFLAPHSELAAKFYNQRLRLKEWYERFSNGTSMLSILFRKLLSMRN